MIDSIGKSTRQRRVVIDVLSSSIKPLSVEEISLVIAKKTNNPLALSTIYRNINIMIKKGLVTRMFDEAGKSLYELNKHAHNHELECERCHKKVVLKTCPFRFLQNIVSKDADFTINDCRDVLKGYCNDCK